MASEEFLLVDDREVVITDAMYVRCDGGNGPLGHPVEFMTLDNDAEPCGCPTERSGFLGPVPEGASFLPPGSDRADRNDDEMVCYKPLPRDPPEFKFVVIDNRKCTP